MWDLWQISIDNFWQFLFHILKTCIAVVSDEGLESLVWNSLVSYTDLGSVSKYYSTDSAENFFSIHIEIESGFVLVLYTL